MRRLIVKGRRSPFHLEFFYARTQPRTRRHFFIFNVWHLWIVLDCHDAKCTPPQDWHGIVGGTTILLSIVTFGIYGIYWIYLLGKEIRKAGGREDRSIVFLVLSLFSFGWLVPAIAQSDINDIIDRVGDDDDDDDDDEE